RLIGWHEHRLACLNPIVKIIVLLRQFDVDLFGRNDFAGINEFFDSLPESGKDIRRIVSGPSVKPAAAIDTKRHWLDSEFGGTWAGTKLLRESSNILELHSQVVR